jgi:hypothetical protein
MKKSVNGKSFDEIFAQRGRMVSIGELKDGKVYLFDQKGRFDWDWIGRVSKEKSIFFVIWFGKQYIASDGDVRTLDGGIDYRDVAAIHEATPDQIDLLNAYK